MKNEKNRNSTNEVQKRKMKKIIIISIIVIIIIIAGSLLGLTIFNTNWKEANKNYDEAYQIAKSRNDELEALITKSEQLVYSNESALDEELRPTLETAISEAKAIKKDLLDKPLFTQKINDVTNILNNINYEKEYNNLKSKYEDLDKSIKQYALVFQPTEEYVIKCLKGIPHIKNIAAVTEENDPNGKLNKQGGYTATVYYSDDRINLEKDIYGKTVIEQGTNGGGGIEVYSTVEDAEKRRDYLSGFDGTVLSNGTHTVVGTVLIRISDELTASQQKEMEKLIIEALTKIETPNVMEKNK